MLFYFKCATTEITVAPDYMGRQMYSFNLNNFWGSRLSRMRSFWGSRLSRMGSCRPVELSGRWQTRVHCPRNYLAKSPEIDQVTATSFCQQYFPPHAGGILCCSSVITWQCNVLIYVAAVCGIIGYAYTSQMNTRSANNLGIIVFRSALHLTLYSH